MDAIAELRMEERWCIGFDMCTLPQSSSLLIFDIHSIPVNICIGPRYHDLQYHIVNHDYSMLCYRHIHHHYHPCQFVPWYVAQCLHSSNHIVMVLIKNKREFYFLLYFGLLFRSRGNTRGHQREWRWQSFKSGLSPKSRYVSSKKENIAKGTTDPKVEFCLPK